MPYTYTISYLFHFLVSIQYQRVLFRRSGFTRAHGLPLVPHGSQRGQLFPCLRSAPADNKTSYCTGATEIIRRRNFRIITAGTAAKINCAFRRSCPVFLSPCSVPGSAPRGAMYRQCGAVSGPVFRYPSADPRQRDRIRGRFISQNTHLDKTSKKAENKRKHPINERKYPLRGVIYAVLVGVLRKKGVFYVLLLFFC